MFSFRKSAALPSATDALPGRETALPTAERHLVSHRPLKGPYAPGAETVYLGLGCFWGAERKFWQQGPGVEVTAVGYQGGTTPNPTYEEVCSGMTGHTEVVKVVYDPAVIGFGQLLKTFWESHDPTQGMRQGNDVGTQYRSAIYTTTARPARGGGGVAQSLPGRARRQGRTVRLDHDRDQAGADLLLRRGLPSAISRPEPGRLLQPCRHGGELPGGGRRGGRLRTCGTGRVRAVSTAARRGAHRARNRVAASRPPAGPGRATAEGRRDAAGRTGHGAVHLRQPVGAGAVFRSAGAGPVRAAASRRCSTSSNSRCISLPRPNPA